MNLAEFHFIRPYYLLALIPAGLILWFTVKNKLSNISWNTVCDEALMPFILEQGSSSKQHWSILTIGLASLLAIIALAGPAWQKLPAPAFTNDAALVIILDLSKSMDATDIKPSRLARARYKIADILKQRKDGLTGLVVYAGDAFTVTPLSTDTQTISNQLTALITDIMPNQGSNTVAAIKLAADLLQQGGQTQGQILLLTDDVKSADSGKIKTALQQHALSILGVGTSQGAPIKLQSGGFLKDSAGNIVVPKLNSTKLADLVGNGRYQTIRIDDADIEPLMAQISQASSSQSELEAQQLMTQWDEKGIWLLLLVLPLAALSFRKGLLIIPLVIGLNIPQPSYALDWQDLWQTQNQQAQQDFKNQQFNEAEQKFTTPEWKAAAQYKAGDFQQAAETLSDANTANGHYNRGNALAKMDRLEDAKKSYEDALKLDPKHADSLHNKKLVEDALKEQQDQKQQDQQEGDENESGDKQEQQDNQQSDEKQSEENSDGEQQDDQKNQSDQQKPSEDNDDEQQAEPNNEDTSKPEEQAEDEQPTPTEPQAINQKPLDEQQQENAQWLNQIADDPSGLLKRKFKYQYSRNKNKQPQGQAW